MTQDEARALVERQARAWEQADVEAAVTDFAPDGVLISPGGQWRGHAEIRAALENFFKVAGDVQVKITRVFIVGNQGAAEWTWSETRLADMRRHTADDAIIFELNGDNKIVYWREYFDTADF